MLSAVCLKIALPLYLFCGLPGQYGDTVAQWQRVVRSGPLPPGLEGPVIIKESDVANWAFVLLLARLSLSDREVICPGGVCPP